MLGIKSGAEVLVYGRLELDWNLSMSHSKQFGHVDM